MLGPSYSLMTLSSKLSSSSVIRILPLSGGEGGTLGYDGMGNGAAQVSLDGEALVSATSEIIYIRLVMVRLGLNGPLVGHLVSHGRPSLDHSGSKACSTILVTKANISSI
ncbi:hypothetical protein HAX54_040435, partial [Datura stramonium]|nr:hypothetical protein [Datura stramonium]